VSSGSGEQVRRRGSGAKRSGSRGVGMTQGATTG
jgi:hypothetical protein